MVSMEHEMLVNLTSYVIAVSMMVGGLLFLSYSINKFTKRKRGI